MKDVKCNFSKRISLQSGNFGLNAEGCLLVDNKISGFVECNGTTDKRGCPFWK